MSVRFASLFVSACLCSAASAQTPAPNLTRPQRDLLKAIVEAVDAASSQPDTTDLTWRQHILRASDGSHYVAFTVAPPSSAPLPAGAALLYIRLATASPSGAAPIAERSPVREWLAGGRTDPRLLPKPGIAVGEMPIMGAGGLNTQRPPTSTGSNELRLMALDRERARQEQRDRDKDRRAGFEGKEAIVRDMMPFEDFDLTSTTVTADGQRTIARAFTAGPGDYDLFVAWADPVAPKPAKVSVLRKSIRLSAATTAELTASSIVLADNVTVRSAPYTPAEQAAHPYSIGLMEITPARSARYPRESNLSVAFQIINARSSEAGMPDVTVSFRVVRVEGDRETSVASLKPQSYNSTTLPPEFNMKLGHPLFAAVTAPLSTLNRGKYRLKILITDKLGVSSATEETDFSVVGTLASLLTEAPPLGLAFKRDAILEPLALATIVDALAPPSPSPALTRAIAIAKTGRLVDLLVEEPVPEAESGVRVALTGLAYLSLGEASAAALFQRALQQNAPAAPTQFLIGAARAVQNRDSDAIAAWKAALAAGNAPPITRAFLAEAYLRRNDPQHALEVVTAPTTTPPTAGWIRLVAASQIGSLREADAIVTLTPHLAIQVEDQEARWLLLQAMYAQFVRGGNPLLQLAVEAFSKEARAYIEAKSANSALAEEWLKVISSV